MFTNLKATNDFRNIKKNNKEASFVCGDFSREKVSPEFEPLFLLLETMLQTQIKKGKLTVQRDKIKGDKYGISFTVNSTINLDILENMFLETDYKIENKTFTFYID